MSVGTHSGVSLRFFDYVSLEGRDARTVKVCQKTRSFASFGDQKHCRVLIRGVLFFSCTSIFIAYKLSMSAILLLPELGTPSEPEYFAFSVVIGITILAKTLAIVMRIVE